MVQARDWLPGELPVRLIITSGASCPDILMNQVLEKIAGFYGFGAADIAAAQLSLLEEL
jgi:4-hydroxy-3-methylbut-2-enyl diphosphate reductase IspH